MNQDSPIVTRRNGPARSSVVLGSEPRADGSSAAIDVETMEKVDGLSPIEQLMVFMRRSKSAGVISDIHIGADQEPWVTMDNHAVRLQPINGIERISGEEINKFIDQAFTDRERKELTSQARSYATTSRHDDLYGTVRIHAMQTTQGLNLTIRLLSLEIPTIETLGLPAQIAKFAEFHNGLIIFTGATGNGKSTSVAALIDLINETYKYVIYCLEDPIEYVHHDKNSRIKQLAMHKDIPSYQEGLRSLLRTAPHVIFVGEMRDAETMRATIAAAETGHLVISTMHCNTPPESIQRLIGSFDAAQAREIQTQFAYVMRAIIGQRLVPRADGSGRVAATEIMVNNTAIRSQILEGKFLTLRSSVTQGREDGMYTLEDDLKRLVRNRVITHDTAMRFANVKDEIPPIGSQ